MQNNKAHFNIIMGDFNAKVGGEDEECLGAFGYDNRNDGGVDIVNYAIAHGSKIMNTSFEKNNQRR